VNARLGIVRILIVEDDRATARLLEGLVQGWGYEAVVYHSGREALAAIEQRFRADIAILDWMLPDIEGTEVCRLMRADEAGRNVRTYILMLTVRTDRTDVIAGLEGGADDYIVKPFDQGELAARIRVGERTVGLQRTLAGKVRELEQALSQVKTLKGLLPVCAYCKAVRDDSDYWHRVEEYIADHSNARVSHGVCPSCLDRMEQRTFA
jgi:DNA-binding response OmpR family regulator